jgi:hypothetical protein
MASPGLEPGTPRFSGSRRRRCSGTKRLQVASSGEPLRSSHACGLAWFRTGLGLRRVREVPNVGGSAAGEPAVSRRDPGGLSPLSGAGDRGLADSAARDAVPRGGLVAAVKDFRVQIDVARPLDHAVLGIDRDLLEELAPLIARGEDAGGCQKVAQANLLDGPSLNVTRSQCSCNLDLLRKPSPSCQWIDSHRRLVANDSTSVRVELVAVQLHPFSHASYARSRHDSRRRLALPTFACPRTPQRPTGPRPPR